MGVGHVVDANTVALWRFDETTHQDYQTAAEENGNYDATQTNNAERPGIWGGPAGTDRSRYFSGSHGMDFTPDAAMSSALVGDWTWEAWIYIDQFTGTDTWFDVGGSGETEATNFLARIQITASGFLQLFWEHSAGTNVTVTQAAGTAVSLRTWTYVAITADVNGGNRDVSFFVNSGTAQDTGTGTNASGGTSITGTIGHDTGAAADITGAIGRIRLSNVVRTGTELNDNATDSTFSFTNDGSTLALWNFDEPPEIEDVSGGGNHLTSVDKGSSQPRIVETLLRTDGGKARYSDATNESYVTYYNSTLQNMMLGEWTIEWWGQMVQSTTHGICQWGTGGTLEANNYLIDMDFQLSGSNYIIHTFWEEGAGTNIETFGTSAIVVEGAEGATDSSQVHHYAVVFEDVTATTRNVLVYVDGVLRETLSSLTKPTGGSDPGVTENGLEICLARVGSPVWNGFMDDMRLSDKARSAAEILASYNRGAPAVVRSIPALPRTT